MNALKNFDFLEGNWIVKNRKLKERLVGSDEWIEFELKQEVKTLMRGLGNVDRLFGEVNGEYFEGISVRTYSIAKDEWTIYWADTTDTDLKENTRGNFEDGVGQFYGQENYKGNDYKLRFIWKSQSANTARWEQAYFDPEMNEWETNWTMDFEKC